MRPLPCWRGGRVLSHRPLAAGVGKRAVQTERRSR